MSRLPILSIGMLAAALALGCGDQPAPTAPVSTPQMDVPSGITETTTTLGVAALAHASGGPSAVNADLAQLRRLVAPYHNVDKALADGYVLESVCVSDPLLGAMGFHAPNLTLRNDAEISLLQPDVLVYERTPNGKFRLNAVEYFVLKSTWDAAHGGAGAAPPVLFGQNVPLSDHPPFGQHYELHVWLFQHNPSGIFALWNPTVSCP